MSVTDKSFIGSIPELYDRLMVPLIFEPYARDLAARAVALAPRSVLEVAAGTGAVTRALAARLPADTKLVATDLNQPMLDQARKQIADAPHIIFRQADAQALPFDDAQFDVVLCQFGAMFFPDRAKAYREAKRVLKPSGTYLFNVWDRIEDNEFADEVTRSLASLFPADPPRFLARTPHGYHDPERIRTDLQAAAFENISIMPVEAVSAAPSPSEAAMAYCQGTPLRSEIEARGGSLEEATRTATEALARRFGRSAISGRIQALVVAAG